MRPNELSYLLQVLASYISEICEEHCTRLCQTHDAKQKRSTVVSMLGLLKLCHVYFSHLNPTNVDQMSKVIKLTAEALEFFNIHIIDELLVIRQTCGEIVR